MSFHSTSRRDDLASLSYFLVHLLNGGRLDVFDHIEAINDSKQAFIPILDAKKSLTVPMLCSGRAWILEEFVQSIFKLRFVQEPQYDQLREQLKKIAKKGADAVIFESDLES